MTFVQRLSDVFALRRLRRRSKVARLPMAVDGPPAGITPPESCAARTGFTLIEVLLAAFVLALGVLGLSAMFAGAARQQQLASQQTRSVTVSRSADAMISENVGKIGVTGDCSTDLANVNIYPGQRLYPGQWFCVPVKIEAVDPAFSFLSINPDQDWDPGNVYFREKPNTQLPELIYRAVPDSSNRIFVGKTGLSPTGQDESGGVPFSTGAPAFNPYFGVPRVLSDSVVLRVVTMGYGCKEGQQARYLLNELPRTITYTLSPDIPCSEAADPAGSFDLHRLGNEDVGYFQIDQKKTVKDKEFAADPQGKSSRITLMWIRDVDAGDQYGASLPDHDINCDGAPDFVETTQGQADAKILFSDGKIATGPDRFDVRAPGVTSFYQLDPNDATRGTLQSFSDPTAPGKPVYVSGSGPYTTTWSTTAQNVGYVRPVNANWRFVSEIWLDSFEYRGHRLVSASDRVWYTQDQSRPNGRRADVAYSLLYRDLGPGAGAQYIVFTYALRPASVRSDYVPPERKDDIQVGKSPVTLVEDVDLAYDPTLNQYFMAVPKDDPREWAMQPGQIVVFAGDGSKNPPLLGADSPVRVQFKREMGGKVRGYLESAPRVGNQSLLEYASPNRSFNVWAVQPTVKSLDGPSANEGSVWGLRPIEARVFEVYEN